MEFLHILKSLTYFNKVCIDNTIFKLHYRFTFRILLFCAALVTFRQFITKPIQCIGDESIKEIMDTYCWIHSTSAIVARDPVTNEFGYLNSLMSHDHLLENYKVEYDTYYQWIWIVLVFQAGLFYLPHWFWKTWEGGRIKMLVSELRNSRVISEDINEELRRQHIMQYLTNKKGHHKNYGLQFFFCEVLNFLNVIAQIFCTDAYLGNQFTKNGWEILERNDFLARTFPTVTSCSIGRYGPSGNFFMQDTLCVLPINTMNEKIYITIWFWFILVATVSAAAIFYRVLVFTTPYFRRYEIRRYTCFVKKDVLNTISTHFAFGDRFLLAQLGKNIGAISFGELLKELTSDVEDTARPLISMNNYQEVADNNIYTNITENDL